MLVFHCHFIMVQMILLILKTQAPEMEQIVNLGRDLYSFVRPINKYILMPVFDFIAGFVKNFGWVVLWLTVFIRLVTSPLDLFKLFE